MSKSKLILADVIVVAIVAFSAMDLGRYLSLDFFHTHRSVIDGYVALVEANRYAAGEWKRAHAPQRALRWLERYHTWARS
jgi:hypothetical protein